MAKNRKKKKGCNEKKWTCSSESVLMSKQWVTWKWSRTDRMGENWQTFKLAKKWMQLGGDVRPTLLLIS